MTGVQTCALPICRRFGSDKSLYRLRGKPLIEHVIETIRPLAATTAIIADDSRRFEYLGLPCHRDIITGLGPIGGLYTALTLVGTGHALILGCDTPYLNRELLSYMIGIRSLGDIIIPFYRDMYEPLQALYSTACLPSIEKTIKEGRRQVISFFSGVTLRAVAEPEIRQFADPAMVFKNINYLSDAAE